MISDKTVDMMGGNSLKYVFHDGFKEVPIRDLLSTKQMYPCDTIVIQQRLRRVVKSATAMDAEDIDDWLHEGDILIMSHLMRTYLTEELINTLYRKQVSGVITHKLYEEYITTEQKNLLMNYCIPPISIGDNVPWHDMVVLIQNLVTNNQTQRLVENQNLQNSVIDYLSKDYTLSSLYEIVHNLTQITVATVDYNLRLQDSSNDNGQNTGLYNLRISALHHRISTGKNFNGVTMSGYRYQDTAINGEYQYFIIPSHISRSTSAFFITVKYRSFAETLPPELVRRLETIESTYSLENNITAEFEKSNYYFRGIVFEGLLDMSHEDHTRKKQIDLSLNTKLSGSYYLLLINSRKDLNISNNVGLLTGSINHLEHIKLYSDKSLVFLYKEQWVIPTDNKVPSIKAMGTQLYDALSTYFSSSHFVMGINGLHHHWGPRKTFNEAAFAINYTKNKQDNVCLLVYGKLRIVKLLTDSNGNINDAYLNGLYQSYLKPIVDYDGKHSPDLYLILEYFFSSGLPYKITSEKLFIHVSTLHAGIAKIENLAYVSFSNPDSITGFRLTTLLNQFNYFPHHRWETLQ